MLSLFREAVRPGLRLALALFFRRLAILGARRVPPEGPLILSAVAGDPFLDALLLQAATPRPLVPLARTERFAGRLGGPLLRAFRALPIGLSWDAHAAGVNTESVSRCEHILVGGKALALVVSPEREGGEDPALGVVLAAVEEAVARGVTPVLLPVELGYTWRGLGRGEARVAFGRPRDFTAGAALLAGGPARRAALSDVLSKALGETAALSDRREDLDLLERLAPMAGGDAGPDLESLPPKLRAARLEFPLLVRRLLRAGKRYFDLLEGLGISDGQVTARGEEVRVPDLTYLRLFLALAGLPASAFGWTFHVLPYVLCRWAAGRRAPRALGAARAALFFFPLCYALQAWALSEAIGWWMTVLCLLSAPAAGLWFLVYGGIRRGSLQAIACLLRWRLPGHLGRALLASRAELLEAMEPLRPLFLTSPDLPGPQADQPPPKA